MDKDHYFNGGKLIIREAGEGMINGQTAKWKKALVIEIGKNRIQVGRSFLEKIQELEAEPDFMHFMDTCTP
jgi:hypothetical protein